MGGFETKNNVTLDPVTVDLRVTLSVETIAVLVFITLVLLSWGVVKLKKG